MLENYIFPLKQEKENSTTKKKITNLFYNYYTILIDSLN